MTVQDFFESGRFSLHFVFWSRLPIGGCDAFQTRFWPPVHSIGQVPDRLGPQAAASLIRLAALSRVGAIAFRAVQSAAIQTFPKSRCWSAAMSRAGFAAVVAAIKCTRVGKPAARNQCDVGPSGSM